MVSAQGGGVGVSDGNVSSDRRASAPRDEDHQPERHSPDGKKWKCQREAATGAYLCGHHLAQAKKSYSTSLHYAASKKPATQRAQPKKASTANKASNPYDFYYYSGFGPRWAKKRGQDSNNNNIVVNGGGMDDEIKQTAAYENDSDFEEYDEEVWSRSDTGKRGRKPIKARSLKSLM